MLGSSEKDLIDNMTMTRFWTVSWIMIGMGLKHAQFLDMQDILEEHSVILFTERYAIGKLPEDCLVEIIMKAFEWQFKNLWLI